MEHLNASLAHLNPVVRQLIIHDIMYDDSRSWDILILHHLQQYSSRDTFMRLCRLLTSEGYYHMDYHQNISVEESVAIFITTVARRVTQRHNGQRFQHSRSTVSHHVRKVCHALQGLATMIIKPHGIGETPKYIRENSKYYPYFKNCLGAIDGTLIPVRVPVGEHPQYRTRKGGLAQNVLAVCDWDILFIFVCVGFEGSAHDSRILQDTANNPNTGFPVPPPGCYTNTSTMLAAGWYYLVDVGYTNTKRFLAPYKGDRYHLSHWRGAGRQARSPKELFNKRHAALRNVIERCFSVLKGLFQMLEGITSYNLQMQGDIVMACCALHNFIKLDGLGDELFDAYADVQAVPGEGDVQPIDILVPVDLSRRAINELGQVRDAITKTLWNNRG